MGDIRLVYLFDLADKALLDELQQHLSGALAQASVTSWDQRKILAGTSRAGVLLGMTRGADVVVVLIGLNLPEPDSDNDQALRLALERRQEGTCRLVPIRLQGATLWPGLEHLQLLPRDGAKPIAGRSKRDRGTAWSEVAEDILGVLAEVRARRLLTPPSDAPDAPRGRPTIFLSRKHSRDPDVSLSNAIVAHLGAERIRIDDMIRVGRDWASWIRAEIDNADFFVVLLSEGAVTSQVLVDEIEIAHASWLRKARPVILPVRLRDTGPLPGRVAQCLHRIEWTTWDGPADTPRLLAELHSAVFDGGVLPVTAPQSPLAPPALVPHPAENLPHPDGTMEPESPYYIERDVDERARSASVGGHAFTLTIVGPRQVGKSSLLVRICRRARESGTRVAHIDFQSLELSPGTDAGHFFHEFCSMLCLRLKIEDRVQLAWRGTLGHPANATEFLAGYVLPAIGSPLLIALDEVDRIYNLDFRTSFFALLRSWHNARGIDPAFSRLSLAFVTSTEPHLLISGHQSPFNVGEVLLPEDFLKEQVGELNLRHGGPLTAAQVRELTVLLGGHPFLTRRAFYLISTSQFTFERLIRDASEERGPFGDHLRWLGMRISAAPEIIPALAEVLKSGRCPSDELRSRLLAAGLVKLDERARLVPRCQLYRRYFESRIHVNA